MGCEAALKQVTSAVSGTPRRSILLPVPGSSRASSLPRPPARSKSGRVSIWPTTELLPGGRGSELARERAYAFSEMRRLKHRLRGQVPPQKRSVAQSAPTLIDRGRATR
ncbi:hypothetical protein CU664_28415 [Pseudomonas syringae pv. actinidifoliorum]|nr:hypothetical protein [Pseudomonas syringae pv. actinidifoliorum]